MGDWMEELASQFPDAFFDRLDGGIQLDESEKSNPAFPPGEMYIMGEYCRDLGRYIVLYYGSFAALLKEEPESAWREEIFRTIAHEFTHHMEGKAMLRSLEERDEEFLRQALDESAPDRR